MELHGERVTDRSNKYRHRKKLSLVPKITKTFAQRNTELLLSLIIIFQLSTYKASLIRRKQISNSDTSSQTLQSFIAHKITGKYGRQFFINVQG